jgi:hypothetical protein
MNVIPHGVPMRKKGPRSIPDFSRKKKGPKDPASPPTQTPPMQAPRDPHIKPLGTAAKSGRRGQSR